MKSAITLTFGLTGTPAADWITERFDSATLAADFTAGLIRSLSGPLESARPSLWLLDHTRPRVSLTGGQIHYTLDLTNPD